ncbi:MAG: c-type cytochrome [Gammaproteobacteria bacterium]
MRRSFLLSVVVLIAALAVTACSGKNPESAHPFSKKTQDYKLAFPKVGTSSLSPTLASEIKKGKYLTKLADCMACHTDHTNSEIKGPQFAGGLPMQTPFGVIYSRNITPDKKTGIGDWTFKQFDDAVRYGIAPQGYLFAAMPYNYYNLMSQAQVHAIWEYLKRVPAVHKKNKAIAMPPPFRWRWLQIGWRFLFFKPAEDTYHYDPQHPYDPNRSEQWNRGRFIVEGPAHCGDCHTAHSLLGSPQNSHALTGSGFSGWWAPNVGSAVAGVHSIKTITRVFSEGRGLAGGKLKGPMLDAISNSFKYMTPADMRAVAVYIQSVSGVPASGPRPVSPAAVNLARGHKTYQADCAACHDSGIGGAPRVGNAKDWRALEKEPFFVLYENVWHGVSIMPPKGGCNSCSARDITSAVAWMLEQGRPGKKASEAEKSGVIAASASKLPQNEVSQAVGKQIYQAHCAACHASGLEGAPRYGNKSQWATRLKLGLDQLHQNALDGIGAMPPKGGCTGCSKDQIISAVNYIVAGSGGKALLKKQQAGGG